MPQPRRPQPRIACSGWNYAAWRGRFYPADLRHGEWLGYYASIFDTVEINNTFYRLPQASTFSAWRRQTPAKFLMAVKASRFLTHLKRLREPKEPVRRLMSRARPLGPRLGPILYQLPPTFAIDLARRIGAEARAGFTARQLLRGGRRAVPSRRPRSAPS